MKTDVPKRHSYSRLLFPGILFLLACTASGCSLFSEKPAAGGDLLSLSATTEQIRLLEEPYFSGGHIPEEQVPQVIDSVASYAEELKEDDILSDYEASASNVWMQYPDGLQLIYTPDTGLSDAIGTDSFCRIVTCQPYADAYPDSVAEEMGFPDSAAEALSRLSDQWSFEDNYDMEEVSLDLLKELSGPQILLWHGHGGWTSETHSFLATGETFSQDRYQNDANYYEDFREGRTVLCSDGRVAVTKEFVREYTGDLDGSVIYLGTCQSGSDTELADAFLEKGAAAVVANTDTIRTAYNTRMMYSTMEGLGQTDPGTGEPNTLSQAMAYASRLWGSTDSQQFGGSGAKPVLIGEDVRILTSSRNETSGLTPDQQAASLQDYADSLTCLTGIYHGYFEHTSDGTRYNYWKDLPVLPLTFRIDDFDGDGQEELLLIDTNQDYTLSAVMYENTGGTVQSAARQALPCTAASICEDGYVDCMLYQQDGRLTLGIEERGQASHLSDGSLIRFTALFYDGSGFQMVGTQEYLGSGGTPEEGAEFEAGMREMGISVDFNRIFYSGQSIYSALPSPVILAHSQTFCTWEDQDWLEFMQTWMEDTDAPSTEASLIEFR